MSYEVRLDMFRGPFDLLYYLIEKDEIDIYHIPIARITDEYLSHLKKIEALDVELASEFIVMAASLIYLKSRLLLPELAEPPMGEDMAPDDLYFRTPEEMTKQLETYKLYKEAARWLSVFELERRKIYLRTGQAKPEHCENVNLSNLCLKDLFDAFQRALSKLKVGAIQKILLAKISLEEKIAEILEFLSKGSNGTYFFELVAKCENRHEIVITFLAILELARMAKVQIWQRKNFTDFKIETVVEESAA
jgi:segregation and condensation protein A